MKLLAVPGTGFISTSVNVHRSDLMIVSDWVEGSVLFFDQPISKMDVRDFLCDTGYYEDQSFAMEFVEQIWTELASRTSRMGVGSAGVVVKDVVEPKSTWKDALGHTFCLMLAHLQQYSSRQYPALYGKSYISQGDLFERFSAESLHLLGWRTLRTGWASGIANPAFGDIINAVASELNEEWKNEPAMGVFDTAKEEGLDLVIHRPFADTRAGRAYFLVQCASGGNWRTKLKTPDLEVWTKLVVFTTTPRRGFCFPLVLDEKEFKKNCIRCDGLFIDRCRLLSGGTGMTSRLSAQLRTDLEKWLAPRVGALPTA